MLLVVLPCAVRWIVIRASVVIVNVVAPSDDFEPNLKSELGLDKHKNLGWNCIQGKFKQTFYSCKLRS